MNQEQQADRMRIQRDRAFVFITSLVLILLLLSFVLGRAGE
jgi:hypothetical protein